MNSEVTFEDIVELKIDNRGKTPPVVTEGHPLVEVNALVNCGLHPNIAKVSKFVDDETWETWFRQHLQKDDVVFSTVGTIGETAIVSSEPNYGIAQNILGFRFKKDLVFPLYILYLMRSSWFVHQVTGRTIETVQKSIKWSDMRGIKLSLPPVPTQEKVAKILGDLDRKIELNRQMNETLEQIGQTLFKHYFVDNPKSEGWAKVPMSEVCEKIASGGTPATKEASYYGGNIDWYSTKELQDNFLFKSEKTITNAGLSLSSAKLFPINTVVMAIYAAPTVGRLGILFKESAFNQAACGFVAKEYFGYEFIYLQLLTSRDILNNMANGAAQQNISVGKVRDFKTVQPDENTMQEFKSNIKPIFERIKNNSLEITMLVGLRDSLLPKLLNGQVTV